MHGYGYWVYTTTYAITCIPCMLCTCYVATPYCTTKVRYANLFTTSAHHRWMNAFCISVPFGVLDASAMHTLPTGVYTSIYHYMHAMHTMYLLYRIYHSLVPTHRLCIRCLLTHIQDVRLHLRCDECMLHAYTTYGCIRYVYATHACYAYHVPAIPYLLPL